MSRLGSRSVIIVQPEVPAYRVPFFNRVSKEFNGDLIVYASVGSLDRLTSKENLWERRLGPTLSTPFGIGWQIGAASVPMPRNAIVVVSGGPRIVSNLVLLSRARLRGNPTLWWGHYWSSSSRGWRARIRLLLMRLATGVLFYTEREIENYRKEHGAKSRFPLFALNNGVGTSEIRKLRTPYDAVARRPCIFFIGRLTPKAELHVLLDALALPACENARLEVVGDGPEKDALSARATSLGISDRITFHGPTTNEDEIARVANMCAIFCYPGSVGLSIVHALAYGLPAVVHDDRWAQMPEFAAFQPEVNGRSFRKGDVQGLGRVLSGLICEPERLDRMSMEAIETTEASFNTEDMARRFCGAVEHLRRLQLANGEG